MSTILSETLLKPLFIQNELFVDVSTISVSYYDPHHGLIIKEKIKETDKDGSGVMQTKNDVSSK